MGQQQQQPQPQQGQQQHEYPPSSQGYTDLLNRYRLEQTISQLKGFQDRPATAAAALGLGFAANGGNGGQ